MKIGINRDNLEIADGIILGARDVGLRVDTWKRIITTDTTVICLTDRFRDRIAMRLLKSGRQFTTSGTNSFYGYAVAIADSRDGEGR